MCKKCEKDSSIRNTRYCDDWWKDTHHGGYAGNRKYIEYYENRQKEIDDERESPFEL